MRNLGPSLWLAELFWEFSVTRDTVARKRISGQTQEENLKLTSIVLIVLLLEVTPLHDVPENIFHSRIRRYFIGKL